MESSECVLDVSSKILRCPLPTEYGKWKCFMISTFVTLNVLRKGNLQSNCTTVQTPQVSAFQSSGLGLLLFSHHPLKKSVPSFIVKKIYHKNQILINYFMQQNCLKWKVKVSPIAPGITPAWPLPGVNTLSGQAPPAEGCWSQVSSSSPSHP